MNRQLQMACFCALAPLCVGTAIFLSWLAFRWDMLMIAGIVTIYVSIFLFLFGTVCLIAYWFRGTRKDFENQRTSTKKSVLVAVLLLINWPLALFYAAAAIDIETRYDLVVVNDSASAVDVRVSGGGIQVDFGTIRRKSRKREYFHFEQDGELVIQTTQNGTQALNTVETYVTPGLGGSKHVVIEADGQIQLVEVD